MKVREGMALCELVTTWRDHGALLDTFQTAAEREALAYRIEAAAYRHAADDLERVLNELYLDPTA